MAKFKRYQHIERYGTEEVEGIEIGTCVVMPKIDGTNGSVFLGDDKNLHGGARRREVSIEADNQGFYELVSKDERLIKYLEKHPTHRLFGEFLIPHSLRTYRADAWGKFYVFDVVDSRLENDGPSIYRGYLPYEEYKPLLEEFGIDYIPVLKTITNGTKEDFLKCAETNTFLIKDGKGAGEGIVIKNYDYRNKYGRQVWAKIVLNEFKEKHLKEMGSGNLVRSDVEIEIAEEYVTKSLCEKEFAKISEDGWDNRRIPELLGKIYHELITEECWNFVKKYKNPTIDFKRLQHACTAKVKENLPDVFS